MKHSQHLFTSLPFSSFHLLWQRPTLPNPYVGKARQKALVFYIWTICLVKPMDKNNTLCQYHLPIYPSID